MTAFFVTGASGFIGRHVLATLGAAGDDVRCLTRHRSRLTGLSQWRSHWTAVEGDLHDTPRYAEAIPPGGTIIHMAGLAGKHPAAALMRDNVEGTRRLVATASARGAAHVVFVSSIAATYPDARHYPYSVSKRDAERLVRESGLAFTVLRPTIVLGPGSTSLDALARLALLPVPLVFGDGEVAVQPVHVLDVAATITGAARERWRDETIDVGGPEVLSLNALLARIREARGLRSRSPVHLPLEPVRRALSILEPVARPLLPLSGGQLAAFAFSSRATQSARLDSLLPRFRSVREMVAA